jgi:hypothetical protein
VGEVGLGLLDMTKRVDWRLLLSLLLYRRLSADEFTCVLIVLVGENTLLLFRLSRVTLLFLLLLLFELFDSLLFVEVTLGECCGRSELLPFSEFVPFTLTFSWLF